MSDFFTTQLLVRLITSFICSIAFAVVYRVAPRHLIYGGISGFITYFVYHTVIFFAHSVFAAAFVSTMFAAIFAEVAARKRRAPTIVFLVPGVIPTVPGGDLYRGMRGLLAGNTAESTFYFLNTIKIGLGIAGGIVAISILFGTLTDRIAAAKARKAKTQQNDN
ncbi:MAG: threonine/serine exporter family protein [Clostridia bacterium]|nr:threonine/serine exporter family protein [Clostridia bacterium]